ncbi:MAG: VOC family protein [Methylocystaceae bacterium]|nr:VOC family protein [Methylocystaceae bacterium]
MIDPTYILLYVANVAKSVTFYQQVLEKEPVEHSAHFALFVLDSGLKLGCWSRDEVEPQATITGGGAEVAVTVDTVADVNMTFEKWKDQGISILQEPTAMDFGFTFLALDPDGHRLRIFAPNDHE